MRFTEDLVNIFSFAAEETLRTGCSEIGPDHMMLALLRCRQDSSCKLLESMGVKLEELKILIDNAIQCPEKDFSPRYEDIDKLKISDKGRNVTAVAAALAQREGEATLSGLHLLKAIVKNGGSFTAKCLRTMWNVDAEKMDESTNRKTNEKTDSNYCICIRIPDGICGTDRFKS